MSSDMVLSEQLSDGGKLNVSLSGWDITYYFPGPDRRYNGTILKIPSTMVNQYIDGWKENWEKYVSGTKHVSGQFSMSGSMGMQIDSRRGVWLHALSVTSEAQLVATIGRLIAAQSRAEILKKNICEMQNIKMYSHEERISALRKVNQGEISPTSTNPVVQREIDGALELVRSKMSIQINSCRYHVRDWFGKQAAAEFMDELRRHGFDVWSEQADFVITWQKFEMNEMRNGAKWGQL